MKAGTKFTIENSKIVRQFECYRQQMDTRNDKFERLVKISRDITIISKRIIFKLHQILPGNENHEEILMDASKKIRELEPMFFKIAKELDGEDMNRYHRAFRAGLEEFIEAVSFYWAIKHLTIIHPDVVQREFLGECPMLPGDYFAGLADLTGELMRMCISFSSKGDDVRGFALRELLYQVNAGLTMSDTRDLAHGMNRKLEVMLNSLKKCEASNYTIRVRGAEFEDSHRPTQPC